jgi:hypothetical protein
VSSRRCTSASSRRRFRSSRDALGLTLVQAGFLLSLVQLAGMTAGVVFGVARRFPRRPAQHDAGPLLLAIVSALGGLAQGRGALDAAARRRRLRLPARRAARTGTGAPLVEPQRASAMMGLWGAYMPFATAVALLLGPLAIAAIGWRGWWWALAALSAAMLIWLRTPCRPMPPGRVRPPVALLARLRRTLAAPGPWLVADVVRDVLGAVAGGDRLPAVDLCPERHRRHRGRRADGRRRRRATWPATSRRAAAAARRAPSRLLAIGFTTMALAAAALRRRRRFRARPVLRYAAVLRSPASAG